MKILIDNGGYEFKNNGDSAMLVVTSNHFYQQYPNAEIQIMTVAPKSLKKFIPYATPIAIDGRKQWRNAWNLVGGLRKLFPQSRQQWLQNKESLLKIKYPTICYKWMRYRLEKRGVNVAPMRKFLETVNQADIVVASGGGYITDSFSSHAISLLQTLALAQEQGKPTAMFGQGLGPIHSKNLLFWSNKVLPKLNSISLRESLYSKLCALTANVPENKVTVTGDDAIIMAYGNTPTVIGDKIGVNLRVASYSGLGEQELESIKVVLDDISSLVKAEFCAVPISFHEGDSDFNSIQKLLGSEVFNVNELNTPEKVIKQAGKCRIIITGSYHAGVFGLSQGVSIIAVAASDYYRHKFKGLAKQFGVGCTVVDRDASDFDAKLKSAVIAAWEGADVVRPQLLKQAEEQIKLSESVYKQFVQQCNQ